MIEIAEMKNTWALLFPKVPTPADDQWAFWLLLHDSTTVQGGVMQLAAKYRKLDGHMDADYMVRFASSVMNRITKEEKKMAREVR